MKKFLQDNFYVILVVFLVLGFFKSCSDGRELSKLRKEVTIIKDSTYTKSQLDIRLQVEGLKSEKRMIQATDRRMLDVQRQTEIDETIKTLENNFK